MAFSPCGEVLEIRPKHFSFYKPLQNNYPETKAWKKLCNFVNAALELVNDAKFLQIISHFYKSLQSHYPLQAQTKSENC